MPNGSESFKSEAGIVNYNINNNLQKQKVSLEAITLKDNSLAEMDSRVPVNDMVLKCQAKKDSVDLNKKEDNLNELQKQYEKYKAQIESLELTNSELKVELGELKSKLIESEKTEDCLRKQNAELENKFHSVSAQLKECCEKLAKYTLDINSSQGKEEIIPLNHTKIPELKVVERDGIEPFIAVFEDIPSAGSGWMVIQRRISKEFKFQTSDINEFDNGLGNIKADFWLGTNKIQKLTTSQRHELYIELVDFDDVVAYARYDNFVVGSKDELYKIKSLGSYSGNAGDAFRSLENAIFGTWEYSNNSFYCWWLKQQINCNLNVVYTNDRYAATNCSMWWGTLSLGNKRCPIKSCKMLIRPKIE